MSRVGKRPVPLPKGVQAALSGDLLTIKGPGGELKLHVNPLRYRLTEVKVSPEAINVARKDDERNSRMEQGLIRSLINNMVEGVTKGYTQILDIVGVGYKAELKGKILVVNAGHSHAVDFPIPEGIKIEVDKQARVTIRGADKQVVGEVAASIRRIRPPEPYKGKGIRYADEQVKRKVGKAVAGATGG